MPVDAPQGRRLVIDADVVGFTGGDASDASNADPNLGVCRKFLQTALDGGHVAKLPVALEREWDAHQSWFSRIWRVGMESAEQFDRSEVLEDQALRADLDNAASDASVRENMRKDYHLLEAALADNPHNPVVSRERRVRGHFRRAAQNVPAIAPVVWVNPTLGEDTPIAWLQDGAPDEAHRMLGYCAPS